MIATNLIVFKDQCRVIVANPINIDYITDEQQSEIINGSSIPKVFSFWKSAKSFSNKEEAFLYIQPLLRDNSNYNRINKLKRISWLEICDIASRYYARHAVKISVNTDIRNAIKS
jgi:hypothetical protein